MINEKTCTKYPGEMAVSKANVIPLIDEQREFAMVLGDMLAEKWQQQNDSVFAKEQNGEVL